MPAVDALLARFEHARLGDFVARLERDAGEGLQCRQDFIGEVASYTGDTLGPELGRALADDLRECPQLLTANHHGIDTFAQSTQSNLLFSMRRRADGSPRRTIPVLACGSVPLNNLTYPRGLLVYAAGATCAQGRIQKLPLFPDSHKRRLVSMTQPFSAEMLGRCRKRAQRLVAGQGLGRALQSALDTVLDDLTHIGRQQFTSYTRQATVFNHRLWRRLFQEHCHPPELVYIELESIVCRLLQNDLFDASTICHQLLFDPQLRSRLIENLDGRRGCWQHEKLLRRCSSPGASKTAQGADSAQGTLFFWGVDARGRKIPLCLAQTGRGSSLLRGIDDSGRPWSLPFTPADVAQGLRDGRLLPSIFTSYLLISIARGIGCIGGYYQADYLPAMQRAVGDTLRSGRREKERIGIGGDPDLYLSGMQAIGFVGDGHLLPAGPLEIIASGGLSAEQYAQIGEVTVLDAHIASLYDTVMDVLPPDGDAARARRDINRLVHAAVGDKVVNISTL